MQPTMMTMVITSYGRVEAGGADGNDDVDEADGSDVATAPMAMTMLMVFIAPVIIIVPVTTGSPKA